MKLSSIKKTVADGAGITGQTLIYDSAVSTGSNTFLPVGLYGDSIEGTYAFTTNQDKLYLHTGQGWFNVAIVNTNPTFTTSPAGSYDLAIDATAYKNGTATTITLAATDPEGMDITWGYSANTAMNNIAHISNDSSVYTIEPKTQDSVGEASPANGILTFTATDGINIASAASTFSLTFDLTIANSENTVLLTRAVGDNGINTAIVSDGNSGSITNTNAPYQGTFTPYSPSGYSWLFPDDNTGKLEMDASSDFALGSTFTMEAWIFPNSRTSHSNDAVGKVIMMTRNGSNNGAWLSYDSSGHINAKIKYTGSWTLEVSGIAIHEPGEWYHVALVRSGGTLSLYVNGNLEAAASNSTDITSYTTLDIGHQNDGRHFDGLIFDARVINGSAAYTGSFTPPTGKLTTSGGTYPSNTNVNTSITVGHTKLLTCNTPYSTIADNTNRTITFNGNTIAFSPHKVKALYSATTHGGSIQAYADAGIRISDHNDFALTNQNFTIEWWMYVNEFGGSANVITGHGWGGSSDFCPWTFNFYTGGGGTQKTLQLYASTSNRGVGGGSWDIYSAFSPTGISYVMTEKVWYHCAYVRNGNNLYFYVNGVQVATASYSGTIVDNENDDISIGVSSDGGEGSSDIIFGDYRMVVGTAVYTGAFTPPSGPLTTTGGTYPSSTNVNTSITAAHTKILLKGVNGKVLDEGGRHNLQLVGNAKSDTGLQKYSIPSIIFDGTGDYVNTTSPILFQHGTAPFTFEAWIYTSSTGQQTIMMTGSSSSDTLNMFYLSGQLCLYDDNTNLTTAGGAISQNTWTHVAAVRNNGKIKTYINGVQGADVAYATDTAHTIMRIGGHINGSNWFQGNISDARITKSSRYPFVPLRETMTTSTSFQSGVTTTASNVKLLGAHTSTLTTNSGNSGTAFTVEIGATASAFVPQGGMRSAHFDGSSNATMLHAAAIIGTGVFTIEAWVYITKTSSYDPIFGLVPVANINTANSYRLLYVGSNNNLSWWNTSDFVTTPNNTVDNDKWHHVAVTRESDNKIRLYVDGSMEGESGSTYTEDLSSYDRIYLGRHASAYYEGYICNARITNQVLYTKNFTPPTALIG